MRRISVHVVLGVVVCSMIARTGSAQTNTQALKKLTLDQLSNVEVTLVSRRPEKLFEAAAAIQVLTQEDIHRSGASTLPEALQLASNLAVARPNAHDWAVSARGFNGAPLANNSMSDKLLVMIDGRSIYSPLFGGVFWDVQHVLLEDIDRIEIVSGPGGSLWGANAVNGVINIVTRSTRETEGLYVSAGGGSFLRDIGEVRYGGHVGSTVHYRAYAHRLDEQNTNLKSGTDLKDDWTITQTGFRLDYVPSEASTLTVQGDVYAGREGVPAGVMTNGQNVLLRWTRILSPQSEIRIQTYYDRTWRDLPASSFSDQVHTFDVDVQHGFPLGARHSIVWGGGYRRMRDITVSSPKLTFAPASASMHLANGFIQDEITLYPDRLKLIAGIRVEHVDYSGADLQPSVRAAWTPTRRQTIWTAASRAVHPPSRFDASVVFPLKSDQSFTSEKVDAYEIGYRVRPSETVSLSLATFFNHYDDLRSLNYPPLRFANGQNADTRGLEFSGSVHAADWWRWRGGYVYLTKHIHSQLSDVFPGSDTFEGIDPRNQARLQSIVDLPWRVQLDVTGRSVGALPRSPITSTPATTDYATFDIRVAWLFKQLELSLVGRDLAQGRHAEFGFAHISRNVYTKASIHW